MKTRIQDQRFEDEFCHVEDYRNLYAMIDKAIEVADPVFKEHDPDNRCNDITIYHRIDIGYDTTTVSFDMTKD